MSQRTGKNAPRMLPSVEMAYREPLTRPLCFTSFVTSRMAKGETRPSSVTGTANSKIVPNSELTKTLTETCSMAVIDQVRTLWLINGSSEIESAATAVMMQRSCGDG